MMILSCVFIKIRETAFKKKGQLDAVPFSMVRIVWFRG